MAVALQRSDVVHYIFALYYALQLPEISGILITTAAIAEQAVQISGPVNTKR